MIVAGQGTTNSHRTADPDQWVFAPGGDVAGEGKPTGRAVFTACGAGVDACNYRHFMCQWLRSRMTRKTGASPVDGVDLLDGGVSAIDSGTAKAFEWLRRLPMDQLSRRSVMGLPLGRTSPREAATQQTNSVATQRAICRSTVGGITLDDGRVYRFV